MSDVKGKSKVPPKSGGSSAGEAQFTSPLLQFLESFVVEELLPKNFQLVKVGADEPVLQALWTLCEKGFHSVPVWDPKEQEWLGLVDFMDLTKQVVEEFSEERLQGLGTTWREELKEMSHSFATKKVGDIVDKSGLNPWCPVLLDTSLLSVLQLFSKRLDVHRVPVVDSEGDVVGMVTQSSVLALVAENIDKLGSIADAKVNDWAPPLQFRKHHNGHVVTCHNAERVLDAFTRMQREEVSGLAIVDKNTGKLVGNLSASDVKGIHPATLFQDLFLPIATYLTNLNRDFVRVWLPFLLPSVLSSCFASSSLLFVVILFAVLFIVLFSP
ncbi:hypothetical protein QOT17_012741 [Balamuthia mandrillaris]